MFLLEKVNVCVTHGYVLRKVISQSTKPLRATAKHFFFFFLNSQFYCVGGEKREGGKSMHVSLLSRKTSITGHEMFCTSSSGITAA